MPNMPTIEVTSNETVACAVLCENQKLNGVALKYAIRQGASRLVVISADSQIIKGLRPFCLTKDEVETYPVDTPLPLGVNVVVFDASRFEQYTN